MGDALIGRTLHQNEYAIEGVLGQGGMATVYRARSRSLGTEVAVKVLCPELTEDARFRERFEREARILAGLHHPNLVEVHHLGAEGDLAYIVMRLVPGGTLRDRLNGLDGPLDTVATARLIAQVAEALQTAHDQGLVHLDIKPANVLMGSSDWPLLADFGITEALGRQERADGQVTLAGTPLYMSPEQCRGETLDGRSDQYSLAIVAYEMLTGRRPFAAESTEALLRQHCETTPPSPRGINPAVSREVEDVLLTALAKSPAERYPSVREFGRALSDAVEGTRGMALETKEALVQIAPNVSSAVLLIVLGPFLLDLLPVDARLGGRVALQPAFQLVLALLIVSLFLPIRIPLLGLLARGVSRVVSSPVRYWGLAPGNAIRWAALPGADPRSPAELADVNADVPRGRGLVVPITDRQMARRRRAAVGVVDGVLNVAYVLVTYWMVGTPLLAIVRSLTTTRVGQIAETALTVLVLVVALAFVVRIYRESGPIVAGVILALGWAVAETLPTGDLTLSNGFSLAWLVKLFVGVGAVVILLATRRRVSAFARPLVVSWIDQFLLHVQPGVTAEQLAAGRPRSEHLVSGIIDLSILLTGYALVADPLVVSLSRLVGEVQAASIVSGAAVLLWLLVAVRLAAFDGLLGFALGVLLGAPLLISLPIVHEELLLGVDWPTTLVTWSVGTIILILLASVRGRARAFSQRGVGEMLERRLLGTTCATSEEQLERRVVAFGSLGNALVDVLIVLAAYWTLGVPLAETLAQSPGGSAIGSLLLVAVLALVLGLVLIRLRRCAAVVSDSCGPARSHRLRSLPAVLVLLTILFIGGCIATPADFVAPSVADELALAASESPRVVVDWEGWLPWTPRPDEATYNLALSCSNGTVLGRFTEEFRPPRGAAMPLGTAGSIGPTDVPCDDWQSVYHDRRRAAGLPETATVSWAWLDARANVQPDGSADVVETHHVVFTNGTFDHLSWTEARSARNLVVTESGATYALPPTDAPPARYARLANSGNGTRVDWWFPEVPSPAARTYTIAYHLDHVVRQSPGDTALDWPVLAPDRAGTVWRVTVEITLLESVTPTAVRLETRGASAQARLADDRTAWFTAENVPPGVGLDVAVHRLNPAE